MCVCVFFKIIFLIMGMMLFCLQIQPPVGLWCVRQGDEQSPAAAVWGDVYDTRNGLSWSSLGGTYATCTCSMYVCTVHVHLHWPHLIPSTALFYSVFAVYITVHGRKNKKRSITRFCNELFPALCLTVAICKQRSAYTAAKGRESVWG